MDCLWVKKAGHRVKRHGFFVKKSSRALRIQRYYCSDCERSFSTQTATLTYREQKPYLDQKLFRLLCSGVSQRRCARILGVRRNTVARKLVRLGRFARCDFARLSTANVGLSSGTSAVFDEMETFEHTKCKPLSIVTAVQEKTRFIVALEVAAMPAKGTLAAISRKRYGPRVDERSKAITRTLVQLNRVMPALTVIKSDECPRYPKVVHQWLPQVRHERHKGRRGCVVGQGELKRGGHDPLFSLNHTCAMIRDNIKRLSRRTWCTTKRPDRLQDLLNMYAVYHNKLLLNPDLAPIIERATIA